MIFINLKMSEIQCVEHVRKGGNRKQTDESSNTILKILDVRSISIKNMKWKLGDMGSLNPRNFETKKLRNQETNNQKNKKIVFIFK